MIKMGKVIRFSWKTPGISLQSMNSHLVSYNKPEYVWVFGVERCKAYLDVLRGISPIFSYIDVEKLDCGL